MSYTYNYSQPDAYHFCQDSVLFPKLIADFERDAVDENSRVLDLCAGCGVVGFELKYYVPQIRFLDFLELQDAFFEHLEANQQITDTRQSQILKMNYEQLGLTSHANTYDLIVGNPPFFFKHDGRLSDSAIKNRCRFFIDSDFETLLCATLNALKPEGRAYLLIKQGAKHGRQSLRAIQLTLQGQAEISVVGDIRGTEVVKIKKPQLLAAF